MTVNLENEMVEMNLRENDLILKDIERMLKEVDQAHIVGVLEELGFHEKARQINEKKDDADYEMQVRKNVAEVGLSPRRIFSENQIKSICMKYRLRFLPTCYYKGEVDVRGCSVNLEALKKAMEKDPKRTVMSPKSISDRMFIVAPASSFRLTRKPVDPLLFFKVSDEKYYLLHKWGNDLSVFRRLISYRLEFFYYIALLLSGVGLIFRLCQTAQYFRLYGFAYNLCVLTTIGFGFVFAVAVIVFINKIEDGDFSGSQWKSHYM